LSASTLTEGHAGCPDDAQALRPRTVPELFCASSHSPELGQNVTRIGDAGPIHGFFLLLCCVRLPTVFVESSYKILNTEETMKTLLSIFSIAVVATLLAVPTVAQTDTFIYNPPGFYINWVIGLNSPNANGGSGIAEYYIATPQFNTHLAPAQRARRFSRSLRSSATTSLSRI